MNKEIEESRKDVQYVENVTKAEKDMRDFSGTAALKRAFSNRKKYKR
jgi:hypothetical protein